MDTATLNSLGDVEWVLSSGFDRRALFFRRDTLRVACPRLSYLPATEAHTLPRTLRELQCCIEAQPEQI